MGTGDEVVLITPANTPPLMSRLTEGLGKIVPLTCAAAGFTPQRFVVRSDLPGGRTARVFFCFAEGFLVPLHGFIKKTQKTPDRELRLALQRMKGD